MEDLPITKILAAVQKRLSLLWKTEECPVKEQSGVAEPSKENKQEDREAATLDTIHEDREAETLDTIHEDREAATLDTILEEKTDVIKTHKREKKPIVKIRTSTKHSKVCKFYEAAIVVACLIGMISAQQQSAKGMTGRKEANGDIWLKCQFHEECITTTWHETNLGNLGNPPVTITVATGDFLFDTLKMKYYSVKLTKGKTLTVYSLKVDKENVKYTGRLYKCVCGNKYIERNIREIDFQQASSGGSSSNRGKQYEWMVAVVMLICLKVMY